MWDYAMNFEVSRRKKIMTLGAIIYGHESFVWKYLQVLMIFNDHILCLHQQEIQDCY